MSEKLVPKAIKINSAKRFLEEVQGDANSFFVFVANHIPFTDDTMPPAPGNNDYNLHYSTMEDIMFVKQIGDADISLMVDKNVWTANTIYQRYDSNAEDLENKDFFVVADEAGAYHVFKCLNNKGNASLSKPLLSETSVDDTSYIKVVDDYQWKYLYSISSSDYAKFSTDNFMPCTANVAVANAAVNGSIEVIAIDYPGSGYNSYASGNFSDFSIGGNSQIYALDANAASNSSFYNGCTLYVRSGAGAGQLKTILEYLISGTQKKVVIDTPFTTPVDLTSEYEITPNVIIDGNGVNATARAIVNATGNTIDKIEVVNRGSGYTYASATIIGNTGIVNVTSNTAIVANTAVARVIISPPGGHGSNNFSELYADKVGISVTFANSESNTIPTSNDFRTIGIIKNPLRANVSLTIASTVGSFSNGDVITQNTTGATGTINFANSSVVRITRAKGNFATGYRITADSNTSISANVTTVGSQNSVLNGSTKLAITITASGTFGNGFQLDETVTQGNSTAVVYTANSTSLRLTRVRGTFVSGTEIVGETSAATANVVSVTDPDIIKYSGEILYIENMEPVQRSNTQSETVKLIISF